MAIFCCDFLFFPLFFIFIIFFRFLFLILCFFPSLFFQMLDFCTLFNYFLNMFRFFDFCFSFPPPDLPDNLRGTPKKPDRRFHTTAPASNTTKIPREDPQRERKKERKWEAGEGKKSAKFWAPAFGPPTLRAEALRASTFFRAWAPTFLIFYHVAHLFFFSAFLIVLISCHF